jgi:hypothetical protein
VVMLWQSSAPAAAVVLGDTATTEDIRARVHRSDYMETTVTSSVLWIQLVTTFLKGAS